MRVASKNTLNTRFISKTIYVYTLHITHYTLHVTHVVCKSSVCNVSHNHDLLQEYTASSSETSRGLTQEITNNATQRHLNTMLGNVISAFRVRAPVVHSG